MTDKASGNAARKSIPMLGNNRRHRAAANSGIAIATSMKTGRLIKNSKTVCNTSSGFPKELFQVVGRKNRNG
jgi:hypothetical protein